MNITVSYIYSTQQITPTQQNNYTINIMGSRPVVCINIPVNISTIASDINIYTYNNILRVDVLGVN